MPAFVDGQPFAGYTFDNDTLQAGEHAVLVASQQALVDFRARYGLTPRVLTSSGRTGALNNAGETIVLRDTTGNAIHDFDYGSTAPWPTSPKGLGPSLEVIDVNGDYNDPFNWRASFEPLGSPGVAGLGRDTDGDGQSDGDGRPLRHQPDGPQLVCPDHQQRERRTGRSA